MNYVSCDICVYHLWFVFFPGVFLSSRVTGACPVNTDLILRVHVRTTTTTPLEDPGIATQAVVSTGSPKLLSFAVRRCSPASGPRVTRSGSLLLSRVPRPGSLLLYAFRFEALCRPPADPMSPTQGRVLVYLPLLDVVFPIGGPQVTGELGASVPRPRCHSFVCPLDFGVRCCPCRASHDAPPDPDAVSHVRALAITAKGRGARNTSPASRRATPH